MIPFSDIVDIYEKRTKTENDVKIELVVKLVQSLSFYQDDKAIEGTQERERCIILEHIENPAFCQNLMLALKAEQQSSSAPASATDTSLRFGESSQSGSVIEMIMRNATESDAETREILAGIEDQVRRRNELLNARTNGEEHTIV